MTSDLMKSLAGGVAGLAYGGILAVLGFLAAGAGHGSGVLTYLVSSPVLVPFFFLSVGEATGLLLLLVLPTAWWGLVGTAVGLVRHRGWRVAFLVMIVAHYAGIPLLLLLGSDFAWNNVERAAILVVPGIVLYFIGQLAIWIAFIFIVRSEGGAWGSIGAGISAAQSTTKPR